MSDNNMDNTINHFAHSIQNFEKTKSTVQKEMTEAKSAISSIKKENSITLREKIINILSISFMFAVIVIASNIIFDGSLIGGGLRAIIKVSVGLILPTLIVYKSLQSLRNNSTNVIRFTAIGIDEDLKNDKELNDMKKFWFSKNKKEQTLTFNQVALETELTIQHIRTRL